MSENEIKPVAESESQPRKTESAQAVKPQISKPLEPSFEKSKNKNSDSRVNTVENISLSKEASKGNFGVTGKQDDILKALAGNYDTGSRKTESKPMAKPQEPQTEGAKPETNTQQPKSEGQKPKEENTGNDSSKTPPSGNENKKEAKPNNYTVKKGDCLWNIAKSNNVPLKDLIAANPNIKNPDLIYPGDIINIPGGNKNDSNNNMMKNMNNMMKSMTDIMGKMNNMLNDIQNNKNVNPEDMKKLMTDMNKLMADMKNLSNGSNNRTDTNNNNDKTNNNKTNNNKTDDGKPINGDGKRLGFNKEQDQCAKNIIEWGRKNGLPSDLLFAMAKGESGFNPHARNDSSIENSYGLFQINTRAHGGGHDKWEGPEGTNRAMEQMKSRWKSAFQACGGEAAWKANPEAFFNKFWPKAQGCVVPSSARVASCVSFGKKVLEDYLRGN